MGNYPTNTLKKMETEINSAIMFALDGGTAHPRNAFPKPKGKKKGVVEL